MKKEVIIQILKKHYLLVSFTIVGILVLTWIGIAGRFGPVLSTPIASINPIDTVISLPIASRLDSYLEELKPKPIYWAAKEQIVAMDFSEPYSNNPDRKQNLTLIEKENIINETVIRLPNAISSGTSNKYALSKPGVTNKKREDNTHIPSASTDGFHTIKIKKDKAEAKNSRHFKLVKAAIEGDQKLKIGATLRIRLKEEASWYGNVFPRNTLCYGILGSGSNGRIKIYIGRIGEARLALTVFDQDLQEGIVYQSQEPVNEAVKESSREALNEVFYTLPYGGVTGSLTRLGRNLFGKIGAGKKAEIYLADGYEVYIGENQ